MPLRIFPLAEKQPLRHLYMFNVLSIPFALLFHAETIILDDAEEAKAEDECLLLFAEL